MNEEKCKAALHCLPDFFSTTPSTIRFFENPCPLPVPVPSPDSSRAAYFFTLKRTAARTP